MTNPRQEKLSIRKTILAVLDRDGTAVSDVLISSLKLETGFSARVIQGIMKDMENINEIKVIDGKVELAKKSAPGGVP